MLKINFSVTLIITFYKHRNFFPVLPVSVTNLDWFFFPALKEKDVISVVLFHCS